MAKPVSTPTSTEAAEEVITPLQKLLAGTLLLSFITVPIFSFAFYLLPFYKATGALYRGDYWLIGALLGIALSAAFSYVWMTMLPGILERRHTKREARAAADREERRVEKRRQLEDLRADRAAKAAKTAMVAGEEE